MQHTNRPALCFLLLFVFFSTTVSAQLAGLRGGITNATPDTELNILSSQAAQSYIIVEGKAVLDVEPTRIRIILALTAEAETSEACKQAVKDQFEQLRGSWVEAGISRDDIVEDFISVIPQYKFKFEYIDKLSVAVEEKTGYLMQSNVHLAVADDDSAMKALDIAFANGVTDIIGFDYWCENLDDKKKEARKLAIKAAKEKAEVILGLFDAPPPVINVQENTVVRYPKSLYESFQNDSSARYQRYYLNLRDTPMVKQPRPKNTYYRGNLLDADVQARKLPMKAELSVVSTVRVYYQSPAAEEFNASYNIHKN